MFTKAPGSIWEIWVVIILSVQLEIGFSDGTKRVFDPGDARLVEDTTGKVHTTGVYGG